MIPEYLKSLSPSRIQCFDVCKLRYRLRYIDKIEVAKTKVWFAVGGAIDKALEYCVLHQGDDYTNLSLKMQEIFTEKMLWTNATNTDWYITETSERNWEDRRDELINMGRELLKNFVVQKMDFVRSWNVLGTQVSINEIFKEKINGYIMTGFMDVLYKDKYGIVHILDFKTSSGSILSKKQDYFYQLWYYASIYGRVHDGNTIHGNIIGLIKDNKGTIQSLDDYRFTNVHHVKFFQHIEDLTKMMDFCIDNGCYPPTTKMVSCDWCDYHRLCWIDNTLDGIHYIKK